MPALMSYAQRFEDVHLLRCFGDQASGFYIDIGAGHPVYDNVSFAFYLKGWRGVTVEPNPALARLSRAVRPRDHALQALVGAENGEAPFYLVDEFHGLSTMIEHHARSAHAHFGKTSHALTLPVTTLRALCEAYQPAAIDFLKIDVEGAEGDVLRGADWQRHRPKVVLVEALAPYTLAPAWDDWEPILTGNGYRYAFFDSLNRYYVADEVSELADRLAIAPEPIEGTPQFRNHGQALADPSHPDHALAGLFARGAMARLPLLDRDLLLDLLTADMSAAQLDRPATEKDAPAAHERLFGALPPAGWSRTLHLPSNATVRDIYRRLLESEEVTVALGRISASTSW